VLTIHRVAAREITRSRRPRSTSVGKLIAPSAALSSTASSAAMRCRITAGDTPAMARSLCAGARCGEVDPHISGARTQRGSDFKGRRAANRQSCADPYGDGTGEGFAQ
jgi:hypothetical protein